MVGKSVTTGFICFFFFSSRRRHTRFDCDWSSDVCSSDLPRRVFLRAGEMHFHRTSAIEISAIGTKGRDLELESIFQHHDHPEMRANCIGARKQFLHEFRPRVRSNVDVLGHLAAQQIAHATAREVGHMLRGAQALCYIASREFHWRGGFHGNASFGLRIKTKRRLEACATLTDNVVKMKLSLNWLLAFVPAALALRFWPGLTNPTALFICSAIAIIPVAGWIGRATEELAARSGEALGGLLNATFGNAAELIIAGIALSKGLTGVVKASITGSIIGNILLVLGLATLLG